MNNVERWLPVMDWEHIYEVSNFGHIRNSRTKKIKAQQINNRGYRICQFESKGIKETVLVHRVVARAFVIMIYGKLVVNHKDNNKLNNRAENLEWTTQKENVNHAIANGFSDPKKAGAKGLKTRWQKI